MHGIDFSLVSSTLGGLVLFFITLYQRTAIKKLQSELVQKHKSAEEFRYLAMLDSLTGLHNRRFTEDRLAAEIARAQRRHHPLTVLMLDLNRFKEINDRYGHLAGDLVLKDFADRLQASIRGSDVAARIGGDEFAVLLPECDPQQAQVVLQRLQDLGVKFKGGRIAYTFSAGWAEFQPGDSVERMLQRADSALYASKRGITHIA